MYTEMVSVYIERLPLEFCGLFVGVSNSSHTISHIFCELFDKLRLNKAFMMKPLMRLLKSLVLALCLTCFTSAVSAANIYKPNTAGNDLYLMIERFLPEDMAAVIMLQNDPSRLITDADETALASIGFSQQTYDYALEKIKVERAHNYGRLAYTITGPGIPGNTREQKNICLIVVVDLTESHPDQLLGHEALHCKNGQFRDTDEYNKMVASAWREAGTDLSWADFTGLLDEAMVAGLQVAYAVKEGQTEPPVYVEKFALNPNLVGNSIGQRTARNLIELCMQKDECPTDSKGMLKTILGSQQIQADLIADMKELRIP